jgi:argonaute-like protein implicated in RNA metabolism and viral defense
VLVTTGEPWHIQGTSIPIRCHLRTIGGPVLHEEAMQDIWNLTHLNWSAPKLPCRLPIPLHAAQRMAEDLMQHRSLRWAPF